MKKLVMFCLGAMMVACPAACVNDPTESDATCVDVETSTVSCEDTGTEVADTSTETVVE